MKFISLILFLAATAMSQTEPVRLHVSPSHAFATNTSPKEIVLLMVIVSSKYKQKYDNPDSEAVYDFYFKPGGLAAGDMTEVGPGGDSNTFTKAKLAFVQFADGSTWGDPHTEGIDRAIAMRQAMLEFYDKAMLAYQSQGEAAFLDYLNQIPPQNVGKGWARHLLQIQKDSGTDAAIANIQLRLSAGKARHF